jgi:hypothetical protein
MAVTQISTGITIINSLLGYMGISITNQDTSAATAIATGSKVEVAGSFFTFGSDETPTGWTSITTATTGYIALTPSGTAGSQILSASWVTSGSVVWSSAKQGYYTSASSNIRVVASAYKTSATQYDNKRVLFEKLENIDADDSITNAKLANMSQSTIKGRASGAGTGDPTDLTAAQVASIVATQSFDRAIYFNSALAADYTLPAMEVGESYLMHCSFSGSRAVKVTTAGTYRAGINLASGGGLIITDSALGAGGTIYTGSGGYVQVAVYRSA